MSNERVISLLPGATEIVAALGALDELVGVSHECDYPPKVRALPRVTASAVNALATSRDIDDAVRGLVRDGRPVFAIDAELLARLAPTHILTQSLCDVCAVTDGEVCALGRVLDPAPRILTMGGTTLDGVWNDVTMIGAALGREQDAERLLASIVQRMRRVHETLKAARAPRPRVAVIEWLDPLYAAGHWVPDVVRRAGGVDVLSSPGAHSTVVSAEQVRAARPDLLLLAPCGFNADRAAREAAAVLASDDWSWAAGVETWALNGNALTSRPGPRLADAIETVASIVAPALFSPPNPAFAVRLTH